MSKQSLCFALFLLTNLILPLSAGAQAIDIPDPKFRAAIEVKLGKAAGASITADDMATLTELESPNANISDLTGLEFAINLNELNLGAENVAGNWINSNTVSDLSPLAELTNLIRLTLDGNLISDISSLAKLTNLIALDLDSNVISDISPLAGLIRLRSLYLSENVTTDISSLVSLTNLRVLDLHENSISDISSLAGLTNLRWLNLATNSIGDISSLVRLINLRTLSLGRNSISDISPLAGLINLRWLNLGANLISDTSSLAGLVNVVELYLHYNAVSSISSLTNLTNLTRLHIDQNSISDLSSLVANTGLGHGDTVVIAGNPLSDVSTNTYIPTLLNRGVTVDGKTIDIARVAKATLTIPAIGLVGTGDTFTLNLTVEDITDLAGWELNIRFSPTVLKAVSVTEGDFLSRNSGQTFFLEGTINNDTGTITGLAAARTGAGGVSGTGSLLSMEFEAIATGEGDLKLHEVRLGDPNANAIPYKLVINPITVDTGWDINQDGQISIFDLIAVAQSLGQSNPQADVNGDGTVDIFDLVIVAQHLGASTAGLAPGVGMQYPPLSNSETIQDWIDMAQAADDGSLSFQEGISNLEGLLKMMRPEQTVLLPNYPNPFNPEAWIPYQLAHAADVTLTIYDTKGTVVRQLDLGYQQAGHYTDKIRAAYWDGRNKLGEAVGSDIYFYQLRADDYSITRKMVILK